MNYPKLILQIIAVLCLGGVLLGCSPALNWRQLTFAGTQVSLPCKPDHGERVVQLANMALTMRMVGCEADGYLFAISHVHLRELSDVDLVLPEWQRAAYKNLNASPSSVPAPLGSLISAQGTDAQGGQMVAQWIWRQDGVNLYHWAVYGKNLDAHKLEPMFFVPR